MPLTSWILLVFLACYAVQQAVELGLALLNLRHAAAHGAEVPAVLQGRVTPESARRSRDYTLARGRYGLIESGFGIVVTLVVLFSGLLPWLDGALRSLRLDGANLFVAYLGALSALLWLAGLPFELYLVFGIESRFGFNRMTFGLWLWDRVKGLVLAIALGLVLLYGVYGFMAYSGRWWWLWLLGFLTAYQIGVTWLYPILIAPLFNRFTPLGEGELRERVLALARRAGVRTRGLYVMDASKRSGHSNAYCAGFFRPRIVLFDTLLESSRTDEVLAVLAHEMGHYRNHHVAKALALNVAGSAVLLYVLSLLLSWEPLYAAFGFAAPSFHAALALAILAGGAFVWWLRPLASWFYRRNEYAADAYSAQLTGQPGALASSLVRLNEENLSNLAPHPWYSRFHYTHPTLLERLAALGTQDRTPSAGTGGPGEGELRPYPEG